MEFLIGAGVRLTLSKTYWPGDKGKWKVECTDAEVRKGAVVLECTLVSGPRRPPTTRSLSSMHHRIMAKTFQHDSDKPSEKIILMHAHHETSSEHKHTG